MPQDKPPLAESEIELITPVDRPGGRRRHAPERRASATTWSTRPSTRRLPVIPSLGVLARRLAAGRRPGSTRSCSGRPTARELVGRLVGLSERVESLAFSPDGKRLAVTGGRPARMGEVQVWDVAKRKLVLSVPVTFDTVYGVSWSPDGTKIAFGCTDNTRPGHRRQDRRAGPLHGLAQRLGPRHRLLGRRLAPDLGRPRHDGQADRGRHPAVRRQHHLDHPGRPQGGPGGRRPAPQARRDRRSAAPTASPSSTASSARRSA